MDVNALRTPEERFRVLPAFPYEAHYVERLEGYESLRLAFVDEGPPSAETVFLCLHGRASASKSESLIESSNYKFSPN
jgi:hypothetical protein